MASFRPNRYQLRPCHSDYLPLGRGDACLTQAGFASYAGQTKTGPLWGLLSFVLSFVYLE